MGAINISASRATLYVWSAYQRYHDHRIQERWKSEDSLGHFFEDNISIANVIAN
jgi:hypothetical protein